MCGNKRSYAFFWGLPFNGPFLSHKMRGERKEVWEMKKIVVFILALSMIFVVCACGGQTQKEKPESVKNVERLIDAIGEASLEREKYIADAESAYESLYEADKELIENYNHLVEARAKYNSLVQSVEDEIKEEIAEAIVLIDNEKTVLEAVSRLEQLKNKAINDSQLVLIQNSLDYLNTCYYGGTTFKRFELWFEAWKNKWSNNINIVEAYEEGNNYNYLCQGKDAWSIFTSYDVYLRGIYTGLGKINGTDFWAYEDEQGNQLLVFPDLNLGTDKCLFSIVVKKVG